MTGCSRVAEQLQHDEEELLHRVSEAGSEAALADLWTKSYGYMEKKS